MSEDNIYIFPKHKSESFRVMIDIEVKFGPSYYKNRDILDQLITNIRNGLNITRERTMEYFTISEEKDEN